MAGGKRRKRPMAKRQDKKKVLVIGGGFGGVFGAKALERQGRGKLEVELVNANNYFVFQPL
jgi:NADH dehydrogenase